MVMKYVGLMGPSTLKRHNNNVIEPVSSMNLLYDRKFDLHTNTNLFYDLKLGYKSSHTLAIHEIKRSRGLDIGCGQGILPGVT